MIAYYLTPVSYTHLDVYKRQHRYGGQSRVDPPREDFDINQARNDSNNYPPIFSPNRVPGSHVHLYKTIIRRQLSQHEYLDLGSNALENCNGQYIRWCISKAGIAGRLSRSVGTKMMVMEVPVKRP